MGLAPAGKKIGDVYENDGHKYRVTSIIEGVGYNVEEVNDEDIPLEDLPFSPMDEEEPKEAPKKRGRKKASD